MTGDVRRLIALGASNLTLGFPTVVATARSAWGPELEVLAALGHGRSYGAPSRVLFRTLPGILESGLWRGLESLPPMPTRALVTDVGNDILYGFSAEQTVAWVAEAVARLQRVTQDIVVTNIPLANIQRLSAARFKLFRLVFFPSCRLSLTQVRKTAEGLDAGLAELARARGLRWLRLKPGWYGLDPVHIRPSLWRVAWRDILDAQSPVDTLGSPLPESLRLHLMAPERTWLFGLERHRPQSGVTLPAGARLWLF